MSNVEQEADNSKCNSEESDVMLKNQQMVRVQQMATVEWIQQKRKDKDSADDISSSSSDSEQEEVHCLMDDQTSDDEVFNFSNIEFTCEDLVQALNDMVHEYKSLSHTFEEIKAENATLKNSSVESSSDELEDADSLKTELSKLKIENYLLRNESSEIKAEVEKLTKEMSSWNQSARALHKLQESHKSVNDKSGLGFSSGESSEGETSTQSQSAYDKFNKMSFVKSNVIYDCYESITFDDQNFPKLNDNGKAGIGFSKPDSSKPIWLKNKLDKEKVKADQKPFVPNQPWRSSKKAKSGWTKTQPRRDLVDDIQTLRFNEFKKVVLEQGVNAGSDSVEIRKEIKSLDAKINSLDEQVAAIRSEQLEFQTKIAADLLSLSTQLGDLVDYIRGGDAKKGEGSSSRRPLPPPDNQGEGSGNRTSGDTVRTTEIPQRYIDNAQRNILERLMDADRERQMERERGSRSGSTKRRRY
ncbi:hypothetical protein F511_42411 [Dorcoceras hygrometricum]|uniref:Uncharacterized protein n=1 Tax=Dorcoceras hygrometricum TaxID=472368 RepID=A0A2Z7A6P5_9LAMI|nr:hypothetical protein F511_42411 [Dorcoceras hygrometricum]